MSGFRRASALLSLTLVALVGGCASARSQGAVNVATFQPPQGWQMTDRDRKIKALLLAGVWSSGKRPPESMSFGYGAVPNELRSAAVSNSYDVVKLGDALNDLSEHFGTKVVSSGAVTLCNGKAKGWETVTTATMLGISMKTEAVFLLSPSLFATAMYTRSSASPPDQAAEHSLRTLCI
jgi:hypothetical protein